MAREGYLDSRQVAKKLGISAAALCRLATRGTLPSEWVAGRRIWNPETIDRYLNDHEAQKRRRPNGSQATLFQGGEEIPLDRVVAQLGAQAPAGFDPIGRMRGHRK